MMESAFTTPTADCPHPEWWHATDDQSAEVEVAQLVGAFVRALQPDYVVETGTCVGWTAQGIGVALDINGHGHLDTLEIDEDRAAEAEIKCKALPVTVVRQSSLEFTPRQPIGFAWFDSLLELRAPEFRRFYPHLVKGGIVGFHDTGPQFGPLLRGDINQLASEGLLRPIVLRTPRGVVFAQVL